MTAEHELKRESLSDPINPEGFVSDIEDLARFVTASQATKVILGDSGAGNFVDQRTGDIFFDPDFVRENPQITQVAGIRQSAEQCVQVPLDRMGLSPKATEGILSQLGFSFTRGVLEGLTAEEWAKAKYSGAGSILSGLYADDAAREGFMSGKVIKYLEEKGSESVV